MVAWNKGMRKEQMKEYQEKRRWKFCKKCGIYFRDNSKKNGRQYCGYVCSNSHHDFVVMGRKGGYAGKGSKKDGCGRIGKRSIAECKRLSEIGMIGGMMSAKKQVQMNRSKGEDYLAELLRDVGFDVKQNAWDIVEGYEIDIFLPERNVAISYNGPVHYEPIFGDVRLRQVQRRDEYRNRKLQEMGIRHIVVKETGKFSKKKVEKSFEELAIRF